jgi:endonuclease YncB( thermonuclease family)
MYKGNSAQQGVFLIWCQNFINWVKRYIISNKCRDGVAMNKYVIFVILVSVSLIPGASVLAETVFSGRVTKVIDGDSFVLKSGKQSYEIRLWGIDSPEYTQPFAAEARRISRRYLKGKKVKVKIKYVDKYDRFIGVATSGNVTINEELVRDGAAWVYRRYCKEAVCDKWKSLEKRAKASNTGLWEDNNAVPPWKWRRKNR